MEENKNISSMSRTDFFSQMEIILESRLKKYFTQNTVVFSNTPIVRPGSSESPGLLSNKEFCSVLEISRATLANWENDSRTKNLIAPFIIRNGSRKSYDAFGFALMAFEHTEKFINAIVPRYWTKISENEKAGIKTDFKIIKDRLEQRQLVSPKEYILYLRECKNRSEVPIERGY